MERDIHIHLRLSYGPRFVRRALTVFFLFALAGDLSSENVTLTTYYPAPSGVYTRMITTSDTYLARDGGSVGVGMTTPGVGKLAVSNAGGGVGIYVGNGSPYGQAYIEQDGPAGTHLWMAENGTSVFNVTSGGAMTMAGAATIGGAASIGGTATIGGDANVGGAATVTGNIHAKHYIYIDNSNTGCYQVDVTGDVSVCSAAEYATYDPGFYIEGWSFANRGGQVLAQAQAGNTTTQVWGLNMATGNPQWMTLKKDDSPDHLYCCPR